MTAPPKCWGPYLFPADGEASEGGEFDRELTITYTTETDMLRLQTGEPPYAGCTEKTVAPEPLREL